MMYEVTLTASRVVKVRADSAAEAEKRALARYPTLPTEPDVTEINLSSDAYDELPDHIRAVVDEVEAGAVLEVLGIGQDADRVYDDGEYRVWRERCGPEDGYDGPLATIEHYDGHNWKDLT